MRWDAPRVPQGSEGCPEDDEEAKEAFRVDERDPGHRPLVFSRLGGERQRGETTHFFFSFSSPVNAIFGEARDGLGLQADHRNVVKALALSKRSLDLGSWNLSLLERIKEEVLADKEEEEEGDVDVDGTREAEKNRVVDDQTVVSASIVKDDQDEGEQCDIQNYQRKIFLGQDSSKGTLQSKRRTRSRKRLAICASLVDKIPNLAGICR